MKILVVCQHYWPETFQITDVCEELVKRGHEVTALVGLPNYPKGEVLPEYRNGKNRFQTRNGVKIIRSFEIGRGHNPLTLAINYYSFALSASHIAKRLEDDFDLVFVYQLSPVLMCLPGLAYVKRHHVPLVIYCCDLWPESMKVILGNHLKCVLDYYGRVSRKIYSKADKLLVQSPSFLEYFEKVHGISCKAMEYIPHFATGQVSSSLGIAPHDNINFFITGNIGRAQDVPVILKAVKAMQIKEGFLVHFVGEGPCLQSAVDFVKKNALGDRIIFHGKHPVEKMKDFYAVADAFILTLNGETWVGTTIPSRLQGYMNVGRPILAAINGGARCVIEQSKCGACVPAGDFLALAKLMDDFIKNPKEYAECGDNGKKYFELNFSKERFLDSIQRVFKEVCGRETNVCE